MFCQSCGHNLGETPGKYCPHCGVTMGLTSVSKNMKTAKSKLNTLISTLAASALLLFFGIMGLLYLNEHPYSYSDTIYQMLRTIAIGVIFLGGFNVLIGFVFFT